MRHTCEAGCTAECQALAENWEREVNERISGVLFDNRKRREREAIQNKPWGNSDLISLRQGMEMWAGFDLNQFRRDAVADPQAAGTLERNLETLAISRYGLYLQSDYWTAIRMKVAVRAKGACEWCFKPGVPLDTHHRRYEGLLGREWRSLDELAAICRECHAKAVTPPFPAAPTGTYWDRLTDTERGQILETLPPLWQVK